MSDNKKKGRNGTSGRLLLRKRLAMRVVLFYAVVMHSLSPHLHAMRSSRDLICDVNASHIANCFYVSISQRPLVDRIEIASYAHFANHRMYILIVFRVTFPNVVYDTWALFTKGTIDMVT